MTQFPHISPLSIIILKSLEFPILVSSAVMILFKKPSRPLLIESLSDSPDLVCLYPCMVFNLCVFFHVSPLFHYNSQIGPFYVSDLLGLASSPLSWHPCVLMQLREVKVRP